MKAAIRELQRRQLLERIYDKMTPEERKTFVRLTLQNKSGDQIVQALQQQSAQLADIRKHQQSFAEDFASNIAGNAVWAGAEWLFAKLLRLIK